MRLGIRLLRRARQQGYRYYTLDGEYFRARTGHERVAEIFRDDAWVRFRGDAYAPIALGKQISAGCLPEKARRIATLLVERDRIARQIEILRTRPDAFPSVPDPGESRPVVGELKQILAEIEERIAAASDPRNSQAEPRVSTKIPGGVPKRVGRSGKAGVVFGYVMIALAIAASCVRVAMFGTRLSPDAAMIEYGKDALQLLLGIVGIVIGRKLERVEDSIDGFGHSFWACSVRGRFPGTVLLLGYIFVFCGLGVVFESIVFAPHPRSEPRLLADSIATLAVLIGVYAINSGCIFRSLQSRGRFLQQGSPESSG